LEFNVPFQHKYGYIRDVGLGALTLIIMNCCGLSAHIPAIHDSVSQSHTPAVLDIQLPHVIITFDPI